MWALIMTSGCGWLSDFGGSGMLLTDWTVSTREGVVIGVGSSCPAEAETGSLLWFSVLTELG